MSDARAFDLLIAIWSFCDAEDREAFVSYLAISGHLSITESNPATGTGGDDVDRSAERASSAVKVGATNSPDGQRDEPAATTETVGEYLREQTAVVSVQIIREGDAPRETDCQAGEASQGGSDASCPDTEYPAQVVRQPEGERSTIGEAVASSAPRNSPSTVPAVEAVAIPEAPLPNATAEGSRSVTPPPPGETDKAGEAVPPPTASPATQFNNPRCQNSKTCHLAHSRDCCFDCSMAWAQRPKDEQIRLWAEANEAAA